MSELADPIWHMALSIGLLGSIGLIAALAQGRALAWVYAVCILGSALAILADLSVLLTDSQATARLPLGLPTIGLRFRLDALSALFGLVINLGVLAAAIYGLGLDRDKEISPRVEPMFAVFAAAMNLVLFADDAFAFLFAWELMSVASWLLVLANHKDAAARHAAHVYLVMASIGTTALLFAFGGMAGAAGGYDFATIRVTEQSPTVAAVVLLAAFVGTGSKAGIMPFHAWLPLAHPAAPSHVSALMSGVMTKVAIYGFVRILFDLLGTQVWWWSLPLIIVGALTSVGALLYAVIDEDVKRVLAYSTIENVGVIFVGLGLSLAFKTTGLNAAAAVALTAALLHVVFHSWYKSLLFLGAGAVLHATGRRDFAGLGGLIHRMPRTAVLFLIGSFAIAALPPLNGFVSEWLLFQSILEGHKFPEPVLRFLTPVVGGLLALSAALAAACFVRVYGIVFLGRPRSQAATEAHEVPTLQLAAMALLAGLCIAGGLISAVAISGIAPVVDQLAGARLPGLDAGPTPLALVAFDRARSTYDAFTIAVFVALSATITALLVQRVSNRGTRRAPAWDCGFPDPSTGTQYTASSFAQPLRRVFGTVAFSARERVDMPPPGDTGSASLVVEHKDHIWDWLYRAPAAGILEICRRMNRLQFLTIRRYLVLMFGALIALLLSIAVFL